MLEDPKHLAAIIRNRSKTGAKPQSSQGSKDVGRSDPEALDELEEVEGEAVSARYRHQHLRVQWKIRHAVLCEKTERDDDESHKSCGNLRLTRLARYLVGTQKLTLRFDHQEYRDIVGIPDRLQIGLAARNATPPMQGLNSTEDILWILGLNSISSRVLEFWRS